MGAVRVCRPERSVPAAPAPEELLLEPPPGGPRRGGGSGRQALLPLATAGGSAGYLLMPGTPPAMKVLGGAAVVGGAALALVQARGGRRGPAEELDEAREEYLAYLGQVRARLRAAAERQRGAALHRHPAPDQLWAVAADPARLWERRPGDPDFGLLRIGTGTQRPALRPVVPPTAPVAELEPLTAEALRALVTAHGSVPGLPLAVAAESFARLEFSGGSGDGALGLGGQRANGEARAAVRAMLAQAAVLHAPSELVVAVGAGPAEAPEWEWVKWLPHAEATGSSSDAAGAGRLLCTSAEALERLLAGQLAGRQRWQPPTTTGRGAKAGGDAGDGGEGSTDGGAERGPVRLPHVLVVLDGVAAGGSSALARGGALSGTTVVEITAAEKDDAGGAARSDDADGTGGTDGGREARLSVRVDGGLLRLRTASGTAYEGAADTLSLPQAEALARQLAPCTLWEQAGPPGAGPVGGPPDFLGLLGLSDAAEAVPCLPEQELPLQHRLRVPIGLDPAGRPVALDLKEAALGGMGPHGLCVGATGSGKSELLRTLVLGLALTHSSEALNFVLADFKGGATFAGLADLPHTSAVITNLADDLSLVDRMQEALTGELNRRQELLRAAGNRGSAHAYEQARAAGAAGAAGAALPPLPSLLLVIDEFSELLSAKPDFIDMFVQVGRIGRSLGVHLLLASQRLEEGRLHGLDTYLSYRIGLRTLSAAESRAALGVPDAYHLPPEPGGGYLRFGEEAFSRFRAGYVSGSYRPAPRPGPTAPPPGPGGGGEPGNSGQRARPALFRGFVQEQHAGAPSPVITASAHGDPSTDGDATTNGPLLDGGLWDGLPDDGADAAGGAWTPSVLDIVVERLAGQGAPAHQVWLPPLTASPALDGVLGPVRRTADGRLVLSRAPDAATAADNAGRLAVPVGLVDRPFEQRRDLFRLDFAGAAGHGLVVGGPRAGKSVLLRTLVCAFALSHTPAEAQFYCLDFGGGGLAALSGLPHVGGVVGRADPARVRRLVAEVAAVLARREEEFAAWGLDSVETFRRRRQDGLLPVPEPLPGARPTAPHADVFLLVDGWMTLRQDFEELEPVVTALAQQGLGYGVHVVVSAARYGEVRPALKDLLQNRVELRLGDVLESEVDRRAARNVPPDTPGRGLTPEGLHFLAALPHLDGWGWDAPDGWSGTAAGAPPPGAAATGAPLSAATTGELAAAVAAAWTGPVAPPVRMLPELLPAAALPKGFEHPERGIAIGLDEAALAPVFVDFDTDPHFLVFGDGESGKTALLRLLLKGIAERYTPEQARVVVGDYRRSLLGAADDGQLLEYAAAQPAFTAFLAEVRASMERRVPGREVTQQQLRDRNWWSGPELFVVVDDYDLVAGPGGNPLAQLLEVLPFARDVGLHVILARRSGGAGRGLFEPVLQRLRELGAPGIVLSGDPEEGALLGAVRPVPQPPGRGVLVTRRRGAFTVQTGWLPVRP